VRFADIRKDNAIDRHNFLAGAGTMPLIGVLTAIAAFLFWRKNKAAFRQLFRNARPTI
jgi:cbb3-type cytochrome oxidase subunit 3